jgi:hypothetical protein
LFNTNIFCYYATFLRLRWECHIQNLFEHTRKLDQFLSTPDAIFTCFGPVQSFKLLGWGSMSLGRSHKLFKKVGVHVRRVLSTITQTGGGPVLVLGVAFSSRAHLTPIPPSSHFRHAPQVRWCKISSINRMTVPVLHKHWH